MLVAEQYVSITSVPTSSVYSGIATSHAHRDEDGSLYSYSYASKFSTKECSSENRTNLSKMLNLFIRRRANNS